MMIKMMIMMMVQENPSQCAKTFYNLLGHISKDQTIQYLLTLVDDFLQVVMTSSDL